MDYYHPLVTKDAVEHYHHPTPPCYSVEDQPVVVVASSLSSTSTANPPLYHRQPSLPTPYHSFPQTQIQQHRPHRRLALNSYTPPCQQKKGLPHDIHESSDTVSIVLSPVPTATATTTATAVSGATTTMAIMSGVTAGPPPLSLSQLSSPPSTKSQQRQIAIELADFAAHMVCYLLFGHPVKGNSVISSSSCNDNDNDSGTHGGQELPLISQSGSSQIQSSGRPAYCRTLSESEIVQPKPTFRKFCLDILCATLLSPSVILLSLKYIRQLMVGLKRSNKIVNTGEGAEHRFFTGALILANKFLDDNTFTNKTWSEITGMRVKDVNHLEMQFLNGIDFRLFTSPAEYSEWLASLTQFTSQYMPSQHEVAYQQQVTAARSPISPVDSISPDSNPHSIGGGITLSLQRPTIGAGTAFTSGSGPMVAMCGHDFRHGSCSQPVTSLSISSSMASISPYIDPINKIQHRNQTTQRRPLSSSSSSYSPQYQPQFQYQPHYPHYRHQSTFVASPTVIAHGPVIRPQIVAYGEGQAQGSLTPVTQCSTTGVACPSNCQQTSPSSVPTMHRKRTAYIAFEDMSLTYRSPGYESQLIRPSSVSVRSHKRFSSSSASATAMANPIYPGSYSSAPLSPLPSNQHHQRHYHFSLDQDLMCRASRNLNGNGSAPTFTRRQHQRSASESSVAHASEFSAPVSTLHSPRLLDTSIASCQYPCEGHPPSWTVRGQLHPLEISRSPELTMGRSSSRLSAAQSRTESQQAFYHPATPPSAPYRHDQYLCHPERPGRPSPVLDSHNPYQHHRHELHEEHCLSYSHRRFSRYVPQTCQVAPRLCGPRDVMSLHAITAQTAKRVVVHGRTLSPPPNALHMCDSSYSPVA
ncbi:hypothetical protein BGZ83_008877 [Gryganskiella cystojenkinii]|nr:hypothetical protein BGZ83_008877 [Gryganskiella cystojenkinii]